MIRTKGSKQTIEKMNKQLRNQLGRPSKLHNNNFDEYELAYNLALLGARDEDIAKAFEISIDQFNKWKYENPHFRQVLKDGKEKADAEVSNSLYHRAMGYSHPDSHISTYKDKESGEITTIITPITKHYPPDTTACIFWLKNRQRTIWRDTIRHEQSGPDGKPIEFKDKTKRIDLSGLTDEELQMAINVGFKIQAADAKKEDE